MLENTERRYLANRDSGKQSAVIGLKIVRNDTGIRPELGFVVTEFVDRTPVSSYAHNAGSLINNF